MEIKSNAAKVKGTVQAPASKSVMQRSCAAALLRNGETVIHNYGISNDDKAAVGIIRQLGATVVYKEGQQLSITSDGWPKADKDTVIDCGESGLSLRMFSPIAALMEEQVTISGHGSLLKRPVQFMEHTLALLNVDVKTNEGSLPVQLKGPLNPQKCFMDGSVTSQLLTGILFSYSASLKENVTVEVADLKSKPYIDLTLKVMEEFGMNIPAHSDYRTFDFKYKESNKTIKPTLHYTVEGDWSNAAFFMVAGAIAGSVTITGLDVFTSQADKKILEALQDCGCRLSIQMEQIEVHKHHLKAFHFDATDCPDLFPPLVVLAAFCEGTSVIEGVHRLEHKESNRVESLKAEFKKIGVDIQVQEDKMLIVKTGEVTHPIVFNGHNDHRIVMAVAIAALNIDNEIVIEGAEAVNKSYPAFFEALEQLKIR
jgi:3-phosphoshikimate 1-carboxyvinyltransferase